MKDMYPGTVDKSHLLGILASTHCTYVYLKHILPQVPYFVYLKYLALLSSLADASWTTR